MTFKKEIESVTLAELEPGTSATIRTFSNSSPLTRRIMTMGINPGAVVTVLRRAPLGDPLEIEVSGCLLTLRHEEALNILVQDVCHG